MVVVIAGEGTQGLARSLAQRMGAGSVGAQFKTFPDGEEYVRILGDVAGQDVVVVQSTYPPARLWKLLLLLNACKEAKAKSIRAVIPYLAYARQDRIFQPGEALSSRLVADMLCRYASQVITVDAHKDDIRSYYSVPFVNVSAESVLAQELKRLKVAVVLAPDAGAVPRAQAVAQRIGAQVDHLEKKRISSEVVEMKPKTLDVAGKSVCIVDDIISTGGTMATALEQLKKQGARDTYAACVHGLFQGNAVEKLRRAGVKEILATDSVESEYSRLSLAEPLADALRTATAPRTKA